MVIVVYEGKVCQQIIIMVYFDIYVLQSDKDVENNFGGLMLQGIDDNVMGFGVLLELVEYLKNVFICYGICFIVISGEEEGCFGV